MKVKGLVGKIYRISSNAVTCSAKDFDKLKDGGTTDLKTEDAEQLLKMGVVQIIKVSKNKEKNNG